jgi:hypothetical protein
MLLPSIWSQNVPLGQPAFPGARSGLYKTLRSKRAGQQGLKGSVPHVLSMASHLLCLLLSAQHKG